MLVQKKKKQTTKTVLNQKYKVKNIIKKEIYTNEIKITREIEGPNMSNKLWENINKLR